MKAIVCAAALLLASCATTAPKIAEIELWRLDCGKFEVKRNIGGQPRTLSNGCYVIRHGKDYMIWDAGLEDSLIGKPEVSESQTVSLDRALLPQLAEIGITPNKIGTIGVSHHHGDHFGQAARFTKAALLIGREDWADI